MSDTPVLKSTLTKTLAIVGFIVTIGFIIFLAVQALKHGPGVFTSLSSIIESMQGESRTPELTVATQHTVVNSGESFQISWTDMKVAGAYTFTYSCADGVTLEVRGADGKPTPMKCSDALTLPTEAHSLFLSATSDEMRFTDITLTVEFTDSKNKNSVENSLKITVVNATIPVRETAEETPKKKTEATTPTYVRSNPNGYTDLKMTILGSGRMYNGVFAFNPTFAQAANNALKFDVKNIGTKVSDAWTFKVTLPDGEVFTSQVQTPLYPGDHVEFTLGFYLNRNNERSVTLTPILYSNADTNRTNNATSLEVKVVK